MKSENAKLGPALFTRIGDMELKSILDTGFVGAYEMTDHIHTHSFFELFAAMEGTFCIETADGLQIPMPAGSVCMIPPGLYHRTFAQQEPCAKLAVRFRYSRRSDTAADAVFDACHALLSECSGPVIFHDCGELCSLMWDLRSEMIEPRLASDTCVPLLLSWFYILVFRRLTEERFTPAPVLSPRRSDEEVRQAEIDEYFTLHFSEPVTEEDMAREFHISKRQLSRILRDMYGMSFRDRLTDTRMQEAVHLLATTENSVETIAGMVGYSSLSGFYSAFRKQFSVPAGQYRRQLAK